MLDFDTLAMPFVSPPRLHFTRNRTPFTMLQFDTMGPGRRFCDVVVIKGAFERSSGTLGAPGPAPLVVADDSWDPTDAARSSLKAAGDAVLMKPTTDVIVTGEVHAPSPRAMTHWPVAVVVRSESETLLRCEWEVTGPRR